MSFQLLFEALSSSIFSSSSLVKLNLFSCAASLPFAFGFPFGFVPGLWNALQQLHYAYISILQHDFDSLYIACVVNINAPGLSLCLAGQGLCFPSDQFLPCVDEVWEQERP